MKRGVQLIWHKRNRIRMIGCLSLAGTHIFIKHTKIVIVHSDNSHYNDSQKEVIKWLVVYEASKNVEE